MERRKTLLSRRASAYKQTFKSGESAKFVLADLAKFCHANSTTHVVGDTHGSAQLEGRRQVYLRIQQLAGLSDEDLQTLLAEMD